MLHQRLYDRLKRQKSELRNVRYIEDMGKDMKVLLQSYAPSQTGTLVNNLTTTSGISENQKGYRIGFGPKERIGVSNIGAPRGTIAQFLKDHPEFRRNWSFVKTKSNAWWALPIEGRELLQAERESGNYGGLDQGVGKSMSAYLYQQEGTNESWKGSAKNAKIKPTGFITKALRQWRRVSLKRAIADFARNMGLRRA